MWLMRLGHLELLRQYKTLEVIYELTDETRAFSVIKAAYNIGGGL
jgi:hypothetical protein